MKPTTLTAAISEVANLTEASASILKTISFEASMFEGDEVQMSFTTAQRGNLTDLKIRGFVTFSSDGYYSVTAEGKEVIKTARALIA
jgi:hypothetical protein